MNRKLALAGVVAVITAGAVAGGYLAATATDREPTDAGLEQADRDDRADRDDYRPADVNVTRSHHLPELGDDEWQVRVSIGSLRDDDRVAIEPRPSDPTVDPIGQSNVFTSTRASVGDDVRVYSVSFDGETTVHYEGPLSGLEDVTCEVDPIACDNGGK